MNKNKFKSKHINVKLGTQVKMRVRVKLKAEGKLNVKVKIQTYIIEYPIIPTMKKEAEKIWSEIDEEIKGNAYNKK